MLRYSTIKGPSFVYESNRDESKVEGFRAEFTCLLRKCSTTNSILFAVFLSNNFAVGDLENIILLTYCDVAT